MIVAFKRMCAAGFFLSLFGPGPFAEAASRLPFWADPAHSRAERVARCASCHPDAYKNWKRDSHSASQVKLHEFHEFVRNRKGAPGFLKETDYEKCKTCHIPQDVFESQVQSGLSKNTRSRIKSFFQDPESGMTGVDCLTCHFQAKGSRVLTRADYRRSGPTPDSPDFCNPMPSRFFSTTGFCLSCHEMDGNDGPPRPRGSFVLGCRKCHMETLPNGKFTHYYFSAHDDQETFRKRPSRLVPYELIQVAVRRAGKEGVLSVEWKNSFSPHSLLLGTRQILVRLDLQGETGQTRFSRTIRFTTAEFIKGAKERDSGSSKAATLGPGATYAEAYRLPPGLPSKGKIKITVSRKDQFWMNDDEAWQIYVRESPYSI